MKGLLQEINVEPRKKNHKLTEYYAQIIVHESKFTPEIINTLGQFLKKDNRFEKFFTDNGGSVDDFYIMLRYPGPIKENVHFGFQHIRGSDKKGLEKWLLLRDNTNEIKQYPTNFDRRHNVNFLFSYQFGEKKSWDFSLRWNLGSGFPFTPTANFYTDYSFADGLNQDLTW